MTGAADPVRSRHRHVDDLSAVVGEDDEGRRARRPHAFRPEAFEHVIVRERRCAYRQTLDAPRGLRGGSADARRSRPLRTGAPEIKLDTIAFAEVLDALTEDGAGVEEHFLAARASNKAEPLVCTESLDCSCHSFGSLLYTVEGMSRVVAPQTRRGRHKATS